MSRLLGLFVGGKSTRMGRPKGLLRHPETDLTLVEHAAREARRAGLDVTLVGEAGPYASLLPDVPRLADAPGGTGPLAGLVALLRAAPVVVTLACDMPFVRAEHLRVLCEAPELHAIAAARGDETWEPFLARYDCARVLPLAEARLGGRGGLVRLLEEVGAFAVDLPPDVTRDWDTPEEIGRPRRRSTQ